MNIFDISKYQIMDPFFFELQIINFQRRWYFYKNHKYKQLIVKNIKQLINYNDPITLNCFFNNNKLKDINYLYPIFRNNNMYIYYLTSLKDLFENKQNEIYTNTEFTTEEINHINFLTRNFTNKKIKLSEKENFYFKKIKFFQKFFELNTYFTIEIYENVDKKKLKIIYKELQMMLDTYLSDNKLTEEKLFNVKIDWNSNKNNIENNLITNIDLLVNNKLDEIFRKHICYIIIGAFSYVDYNIKKIYNNIDFI